MAARGYISKKHNCLYFSCCLRLTFGLGVAKIVQFLHCSLYTDTEMQIPRLCLLLLMLLLMFSFPVFSTNHFTLMISHTKLQSSSVQYDEIYMYIACNLLGFAKIITSIRLNE